VLLGLHSAIYQPKGMNVTRDVPENGETDIDEEVAAAAGDEGRCGWRKENSDQDEADVGSSKRHVRSMFVVLEVFSL